MKRAFATFIAAFLVASMTCLQLSAQPSPKGTAEDLYAVYLKLKVRGLPDAEQERTLSPLLSAGLKQLLRNAKREQARFIKAHPDEKPPWIEGDLFSSLFEGAQAFSVGEVRIRGTRAEIDVKLENREGGSTVAWTDTLILVREAGAWRVWDIVFKGDWQFKTGNNLRSVLRTK